MTLDHIYKLIDSYQKQINDINEKYQLIKDESTWSEYWRRNNVNHYLNKMDRLVVKILSKQHESKLTGPERKRLMFL